jgi:hypothetical protein
MRDATMEWAEAHNARVRAGRGGGVAPKPESAAQAKQGPKKQGRARGAQPTQVDGINFPSKKEARRYQELKILEQAQSVRRLRRQVTFPLIVKGWPVYEEGYRADFTYYELDTDRDLVFVVEDAKGHKTEIYENKKRLMKAIYGIEIRES